MKGTESLTRILPENPTGPFTPEAVEMPFDAFGPEATTAPGKGKEESR